MCSSAVVRVTGRAIQRTLHLHPLHEFALCEPAIAQVRLLDGDSVVGQEVPVVGTREAYASRSSGGDANEVPVTQRA